MDTIEHMAEHPLHIKWKNKKNEHKKVLDGFKTKFNKGLGPYLDIMQNKPGTTAAYKAALKAHQYSIDYRGPNYAGALTDPAKTQLIGILKEIETACKTVGLKGDPKK